MEFTYEKQESNVYLVYQFQEDDETDTLSLGMMTNNHITGLLPIVFTQMNQKKFFKYNITSKIALAKFLKRTIDKKHFLEVFSSITDLLLEIEEYMIPASEICLQMDYIFVNEKTGRVEAVCVPVIERKNNGEGLVQLFKTIISEFKPAPGEEGTYVVRILSFINNSASFSIVEFKHLLEKLKNIETSESKIIQRPPVTKKVEIPKTQKSQIAVQPAVQPVPDTVKEDGTSRIETAEEPGKKIEKNPSEEEEIKSEKKKNPLLTSLFLGGKKSKTKKETALSNDFGFAVPGSEIAGEMSVNNDKKEAVLPENQTQNQRQREQNGPSGSIKSFGNSGVESKMPQIRQGQGNFGDTIMIPGEEQDGTTGLDDQTAMLSPRLIRSKTGEEIEITQTLFVLGRGSESVNYQVHGNPSVGRKHAKILFLEGKFYIEDLDSKNHTYINGMKINSGHPVEMKNGDRICLSNEEFEFRQF